MNYCRHLARFLSLLISFVLLDFLFFLVAPEAHRRVHPFPHPSFACTQLIEEFPDVVVEYERLNGI